MQESIVCHTENAMPLNEMDRAWIRQEIQTVHKRHGLGRLTGFIKDWSGAGAVAAGLIFVVSQWSGYVEFRTKTGDGLESIDKRLTHLELRSQASLPQSVFDKALPDLKAVITTARKQDVKAPPEVIEDLKNKLLSASSDAPDFWPTLAEFISYRSAVVYAPPEEVKKLLTEKLSDCADSLPTPMVTEIPNLPQFTLNEPTGGVTRGYYENCRFTLDSVQDDKRINEVLTKNSPFLSFKNCLIEYHGGEINLLLAWDKVPIALTIIPSPGSKEPPKTLQPIRISGPTITFEHCVFSFSFQSVPSSKGQQLSTALLQQDAALASLPVAR